MLEICTSIFDYLNCHNIRYCHWKSNSHLNEALIGKTDLDILVHLSDKDRFQEALEKFSIKLVVTPREKRFPGLEDYLGFDEKTCAFIHLHVHYKLVMGQKFIKNHYLPVEEVYFNNLTQKNNVFIPCPEVELIILIIRAHMKTGVVELVKQMINDIIGRRYILFPKQIENEIACLINDFNLKKMVKILPQFNLPLSEKLFTNFIADFSNNKLRCYGILVNMLRIFLALRGYRRQKNLLVYLKYSYCLFRSLPFIRKFFKEKLMTPRDTGKTLAFVGADGSGKSTLIEDVENWLSWRLVVVFYYHGIPKTMLKSFIPFCVRGFKKVRLELIAVLIECLYMVYLARRRYEISQCSSRNALAGKIVLTDRFPLKEFQSMAQPEDGPQLKKYRHTKLGRFFSKIESNYYDKVIYPERVFVLQVSIDELRRRKTDLPLDYHITKANAVNALKGSEDIVLIDANKPYSHVQRVVKKKIWDLI